MKLFDKKAMHARLEAGGGGIAMTKRMSCTTLLCEITRLKSQQKYLESNQSKLTPDQFYDNEESSPTPIARPEKNEKIVGFVNEIEDFKTQLERDFTEYRQESRATVKDMYFQIRQIRENMTQPERLNEVSNQSMRELMISVNTQIETLQSRNANELKHLQSQVEGFENEQVLLFIK